MSEFETEKKNCNNQKCDNYGVGVKIFGFTIIRLLKYIVHYDGKSGYSFICDFA